MRLAIPSNDSLLDLHRRLLAGEDVVDALARLLFVPLTRRLHADFPTADEHLCAEAAGHAILFVRQRPDRYDPAKSKLWSFVKMVARRRLSNLCRREARHTARRDFGQLVELVAAPGNREAVEIPPWIQRIVDTLYHDDQIVFQHMAADETSTAVIAAALGLSAGMNHAAIVYRIKDRILKRLRRARGTHDAE